MKVAGLVAELMLPGTCVLCGTPLLFFGFDCRTPLCGECRDGSSRARSIDEALGSEYRWRCSKCSKPLISECDVCTRCRNRTFAFERNISVFRYREAAADLIRAFKFRRVSSLRSLFADRLAKTSAAWELAGTVVPAPGRRRARMKRGYDPVRMLAHDLKRRWGFRTANLLRRSGGRAQKTLSYEERLTNLSGTIRVSRRPVPDRIILLDDVFTTGATANECARVLKLRGAKKVVVLTLALD